MGGACSSWCCCHGGACSGFIHVKARHPCFHAPHPTPPHPVLPDFDFPGPLAAADVGDGSMKLAHGGGGSGKVVPVVHPEPPADSAEDRAALEARITGGLGLREETYWCIATQLASVALPFVCVVAHRQPPCSFVHGKKVPPYALPLTLSLHPLPVPCSCRDGQGRRDVGS